MAHFSFQLSVALADGSFSFVSTHKPRLLAALKKKKKLYLRAQVY